MIPPAPRNDGLLGLLAAHGLSMLGTCMSFLAIPWFVLAATGSATTTGLVTCAEMLPYVLVQGLGGPLAGVLLAVSSAPGVLAVTAAAFLLSALFMGGIVRPTLPVPETTERAQDGVSYAAHLAEGIAFIRRDRLLLGIVGMVAATNLLDQAYAAVLLPSWVRRELGSPLALGVITGFFGIGAVAGNALMAWLAPRLPRRLPFALCCLLCGPPRFLVLALAFRQSPVLAAALLCGLGAGGINPVLGAVEYQRIPARLQARVLGTLNALAWAGIPFGGLFGGGLADGFGLRPVLFACGALYLLAALAPFLFPAWRGMEREAPEARQMNRFTSEPPAASM